MVESSSRGLLERPRLSTTGLFQKCDWPRFFVMASAPSDAQAQSADQRYRALLAVSEAIVSHRDLSALFHELAGRLHQVVRFDYLGLSLHEATSNTMRPHILEASEPAPLPSAPVLPLEEDPAARVWH